MNKHKLIYEVFPRVIVFSMPVALALVQIVLRQTPELTNNLWLIMLGTILCIGGISLWLYTGYFMQKHKAFSQKKLCTTGPFRYLRNPMYMGGYLLLWGIGVFFFSTPWFITLLVAIPFLYVAFKLEEKDMIKVFGKEYKEYQKSSGMFFPRII